MGKHSGGWKICGGSKSGSKKPRSSKKHDLGSMPAKDICKVLGHQMSFKGGPFLGDDGKRFTSWECMRCHFTEHKAA